MLVSHAQQFIYTKTIKTAGTSVESYFERFCLPPGELSGNEIRSEQESEYGIVGFRGVDQPGDTKWHNHMPARKIRRMVGREIWNSYFKFCVIRNPYERVLSAFYYFRQHSKRVTTVESFQQEKQLFERWLATTELRALRHEHVYMIGRRFALDAVVRFESLHPDIERICEQVGVDWQPELLPRFKTNTRPAEATVGRIYSAGARQIVERAFRKELATFEYEFPSH